MTMMNFDAFVKEYERIFLVKVNELEKVCFEQLGRNWKRVRDGHPHSVSVVGQEYDVIQHVITRWDQEREGWSVQRKDTELVWQKRSKATATAS
jgi:hypothetical protein